MFEKNRRSRVHASVSPDEGGAMAQPFCDPFTACDGLDGRLLISAAIQGPPLAWDLGEVSFGAFTSTGVAARPYVDIHLQSELDAEGSLLRPDPLDLQPRARRDGADRGLGATPVLVRARGLVGLIGQPLHAGTREVRERRRHRLQEDEGTGSRRAEDALRGRLRLLLGGRRQHHRSRRRRRDRQRGRRCGEAR